MGIDILKVEWGGKTGTINAHEAFAAADAIEDHVTIFELAEMASDPRKLRLGKLAAAYAALCKHAGIPASAQEIRKELAAAMGSTMQGEDNAFLRVRGVIEPLYAILTDGALSTGGDSDAGNEQAPAS